MPWRKLAKAPSGKQGKPIRTKSQNNTNQFRGGHITSQF
jgi:hypothetical protein